MKLRKGTLNFYNQSNCPSFFLNTLVNSLLSIFYNIPWRDLVHTVTLVKCRTFFVFKVRNYAIFISTPGCYSIDLCEITPMFFNSKNHDFVSLVVFHYLMIKNTHTTLFCSKHSLPCLFMIRNRRSKLCDSQPLMSKKYLVFIYKEMSVLFK